MRGVFEVAIQALAAKVPAGYSRRGYCPSCAAPEVSFVVSRRLDGTLAWICHRAKCGFKGATRAAGLPPLTFRPPLSYPPVCLTEKTDRFGSRMDSISGGYYMPIIVPEDGQIGFQLRWWDGRGKKVCTYRIAHSTHTLMDWRLQDECRVLVLVEDIPSGICVAQAGFSCVALLGTNLTPFRCSEFLREGCRHLILALDPDALQLARKHQKQYGAYFDSCEVAILNADPKDTPPAELLTILERLRGKADIERTFAPKNL